MIQNFYQGNFLYRFMQCPKNFSFFSFSEVEADSTDPMDWGIIIHLQTEEGKVKTFQELESSLKQVVAMPTSIEPMITQVWFIKTATSIFLGNLSIYTKRIYLLLRKVKWSKLLF